MYISTCLFCRHQLNKESGRHKFFPELLAFFFGNDSCCQLSRGKVPATSGCTMPLDLSNGNATAKQLTLTSEPRKSGWKNSVAEIAVLVT
jgi:hypothetical protein